MTEKEVDLMLKQFKYHVKSYHECLEKLDILAEKLSGDIQSPRIMSKEEAKYQRGTIIYKNNLVELLDEEDQLINERGFHYYAISKVHGLIKDLDIMELNILDDYYWNEMSINEMSTVYSFSNRNMYYKIQAIIEKIAKLK